MSSNSTSRMPMLARVGLTLAALLLLNPVPVHAATLHVGLDTYVKESKPGKIFGSKPKIKVRKGSDIWGFATFALGVLSGGTDSGDIDRATLRLWIRRVISEGTIEVCRVTEFWTEGTLTWNEAQLLGFTDCIAVPIVAANKHRWVTVNITDFVKSWFSGNPNFGIAIRGTTAGTNIQLDSKENKEHSHPMEIEMTHRAPTIYTLQAEIDVQMSTAESKFLDCDPGDEVLSGGWQAITNIVIVNSFPSLTPGRWEWRFTNPTGSVQLGIVYITCRDDALFNPVQ